MSGAKEHKRCVLAWLERAPSELAIEHVVQRFELAFGALLRRADQTLGAVTLTAILDRVLAVAARQFPLALALEVKGAEVRCRGLLGHTREQLMPTFVFVLVEFLTVLGGLTAEILTPVLYAELAGWQDVRTASQSLVARHG